MDLDVAAQIDTGFAAMIGHGAKILLEDLQVDYHAGCRKILFMEVLEIAADNFRFDFVVAVGRAAERPRGGCEDAACSSGAEKASTRCHGGILPQMDVSVLAGLKGERGQRFYLDLARMIFRVAPYPSATETFNSPTEYLLYSAVIKSGPYPTPCSK